ncbi:OsmC family protein [Streptomyces sp. CT34]|uniref:OsmC family protein n=1 Tax=Streptomyces sp. CT34 TaxID=1553907 RepID=UPI0005BC65CF|nr:OsmC family protein [Streptomyces sp. CT34]
MRNSFNTSGFSEVAHEIRENPREAQYRYGARARFSPARGVTAHTEPALLGSVKSARDFRIDVRTPDALGASLGSVHEPTPLDLALTAVAACSLKTMVGGGSARGITFESLALTIRAAFVPAADSSDLTVPPAGLGYRIEAEGAADAAVLHEVLDQVRSHSPNHRTLTDPVPVRLDLGGETDEDVAPQAVLPPLATAGAQLLTRRVRWVSGTQFESTGADGPHAPVLRVDQPKQLTGVDWGPNPQEYLLMGLASEVALLARREALLHTGVECSWDVAARARVDIRGLLKVDTSVPVPLQDVVCAVHPAPAPPGSSPQDWQDIARTAVRRSLLVNLLAKAQPVETGLLSAVAV